MPVPADRRASMISAEYQNGFLKSIGSEKSFNIFRYTYGPATVTFYVSLGDGGSTEKVTAMQAAIKTCVRNGWTIPNGVRIYCVSNDKAQNRAYNRDAMWNAISYVVLGPTTCNPGSISSISNSAHPGFTKGHVTCIHELGHVLHADIMGEDFLATNAQGGVTGEPTGTQAVKVSGYAGNTKKEFVAEVFAGMNIGRVYDAGVMAEYRSYHGPEL